MAVSRLMPQDPRRAALKTGVVRASHALKCTESLRRVAQLSQQADANPGMIDRIVSSDPAVVRLALEGAAHCSFGEGGAEFMSVGSLMAAGGFGMALHAFSCAAVTLFFREALRNSGKDAAAMARHAVAVSVATGSLASWSGEDIVKAKLAGAVHNVGLAVMIWSNPKLYGGASSPIAGTEVQIHEMEADLLGFDHQEAGAMFLQSLGFGTDICLATANHHKPDAAGLAKTVQTADMAAHQMGCDLGFANSVGSSAQGVFQSLGDAKVGQLAEIVTYVTSNFSRLKD